MQRADGRWTVWPEGRDSLLGSGLGASPGGGAQGCTQQHGRRAASEDGRQERADAGCAGEVGAWREGGLKVTIKRSSPEALVSVCPGLRPVSERLVSTERAHHPLHPWPAAVTVP